MIMFHEIQIGGLFAWRGANWLKCDATHAVQENKPGSGPEHVPSHESVLIVQSATKSKPPDKQ